MRMIISLLMARPVAAFEDSSRKTNSRVTQMTCVAQPKAMIGTIIANLAATIPLHVNSATPFGSQSRISSHPSASGRTNDFLIRHKHQTEAQTELVDM